MNSVTDNSNAKSVYKLTSIVILMHNQIEFTKRCLDSILRHTKMPFELILVDNCSSDGTGEYLRAFAEEKKNISIHIINNHENLGFAAGNNQGITSAQGEYILLLNNDTIVTQGWLKRMIACAEAHPKAGIIGPVSNRVSGPQLIREVGYNTQTARGLKKFAGRFAKENEGQVQRVLRVVGFCMIITREVIDKIGGLDEDFGKGNFEDDDFSLRAALAGFESWVAKDCFIHHFGSRTFAGAKIDYRASLLNNWQIFKDKWGLPEDLPYDSGYNLSQIISTAFNPSKHYIPLPGSSFNQVITQDENSGSEEFNRASTRKNNIFKILDHARIHSYKGQIHKAVKILLKGIKISKGDKRLYYSLAETLINEKKYHEALEILDKFSADMDELKRLEYTGCCKEALGQDDEAEECAKKMLALDNDCAAAWSLKGKLAVKKGQPKEAEAYFLRALKSDETFGPAYSRLGLLKQNEGIENKALDLLEKGFMLSPTNNETLANYHREARAQKAFERAEQVFRNAMKSYPNHRLIHFQVIDVLLRQEKFEPAIKEIEKAIVEYGADDGMIAAALIVRKRLGIKEIKYPANKRGTLSICMIVKNEEQYIAKSLQNLMPLADEMIVVDTGSSDRTRALAEIFGAKVYDIEWNNDFSEARNYSLSKAAGDWILVMDADELISPEDFSLLREIVKSKKPKAKAFSIVTRNYLSLPNAIGIMPNDGTYKDMERGCGWVPSTKVRLFKNGINIRFDYPVHEAVEPSLNRNRIGVIKCPVPIHHYGKLNRSHDLKKGEGYLQLGIKKLEDSPYNAKAVFELAVQAAGLKKWEEAITLWQRYIQLSPDNPTAHANLGIAYLRLKRFDHALKSTKRAIDLAPDMNDALNNYALIHIFHGKADASVPMLKIIEKRSPDYLSARFNLAVAYTCIKKKEDAIRVFKGLKKTALGANITISCRNMIKELISFDQRQYALYLLEITTMIFAEELASNQSTTNGNFRQAPEVEKGCPHRHDPSPSFQA